MLLANSITLSETADAASVNNADLLRDKLTLLLDSTGEGIYGIDLDGRCTFINRAGAEMLGYRIEQMLGKNMHELVHHSHEHGEHYRDHRSHKHGDDDRFLSSLVFR